MRVLVACEESQRVTIELQKAGHEAFSCDLVPCSGGYPEWHIRSDVMPLINGDFHISLIDSGILLGVIAAYSVHKMLHIFGVRAF